MLLRKFVSQRLAAYYSQPANTVVGATTLATSTKSSIAFSSLLGELHWKYIYGNLYRKQQGQWLTPVELFKPYYSQVFANYILQQLKTPLSSDCQYEAFEIVELGGGRGTNARVILDTIKNHQPDTYHNHLLRYTIIDVSSSLQDLQRHTILQDDGSDAGSHADKIHFRQVDLTDVAEGKQYFFESTSESDNHERVRSFVIALEMLDNLAHDKVRRQGKQLDSNVLLEEARVVQDDSLMQQEVFVPLEDPLLQTIMDVAPFYGVPISKQATWVPSVACGLLMQLAKEKQLIDVIAADFDWLPPQDASPEGTTKHFPVHADGDPIVTSMDGVDRSSYLEASEDLLCDILFPTNFEKLSRFAKRVFQSENSSESDTIVHVHKQADFLCRYGPEQIEQTSGWLTGFCPLLHDFSNCSVMTVANKPGLAVAGSRGPIKVKPR